MAELRYLDGALKAGKLAWRRLAPRRLRGLSQPLAIAFSRYRVRAALAPPEPDHQTGPLIVSGLVADTKGVSEAARLTVAGLQAAGFSPVVHDLRPLFDGGLGARAMLPARRSGGVWILHANAPEALHALAYLDAAAWRGRYRIGYWAYELSALPPSWVEAASAFHELWAPSQFVAEAMRASGIRTPIRVMPHPVALGFSDPSPDRSAFRLRTDSFAVLALGDLSSSASRKNLMGAIEIFVGAFPTERHGAQLVLKIQSEDAHPRFRAEAERAIAGREDVVLIRERLSTTDMRRLVASCDVLLSPHRSEGFGLSLAEAFLLDVPALATEWSGNLDFMRAIPELLIRKTLIPVRDSYGVYRERHLQWAEPDVADGVSKLKALAASPRLRGELAAGGRAAVCAQLSAWSREKLQATALGRLVD